MIHGDNAKILSFPKFKIIKHEKLKVKNYKGFNLINITPDLKKISQKIINRKLFSYLDYYKNLASLHGYDFILYDEIKKDKKISRNLLNFRKKNKHISYLENRCQPFAKQDDKTLIDNEIIVEITEAQNTRIDDKVANKEIQYAKNQGVSVALDDYGVKGSNLERLINTPWNIIKLDKQLIDNVVTNKRSRVAVEGIKTMATRLNNQIIAEGVETKEQLKYLKKIGIDLIQGFLFSKPMPGNQIEGYIKQFSIKNNYS